MDEFPPGREDEARKVLADALARGEARHFSVRGNQTHIDAVREAYRRSGGALPRLSQADLSALYAERLRGVRSLSEFKAADLDLAPTLEALSPRAERARFDDLPTHTTLRDRDVEIDYDVEETDGRPVGVARLRLPEKIARKHLAVPLQKIGVMLQVAIASPRTSRLAWTRTRSFAVQPEARRAARSVTRAPTRARRRGAEAGAPRSWAWQPAGTERT